MGLNDLFSIRNSDQRKISELYSKYREPFFAFAIKNFGLDNNTIDEIYQDSFIALHNNIQSGKLAELTVSLKTYLFQIGKNKIYDYYKQTGKQTQLSESFLTDEMENTNNLFVKDQYNQPEKVKLVYDFVSNMESPCKEVLLSYYWDDFSMEEISSMMNYTSADVAKTRKYKCMQKAKVVLAALLKKTGLI